MTYASIRAIVALMLNVMWPTIIQCVTANRDILEIHNLVVLSWAANPMMNAAMTSNASMVSVSILVLSAIHVQ